MTRRDEYRVDVEPVELVEPNAFADIADLLDEIVERRRLVRSDLVELREAAQMLRGEASARQLDDLPVGQLVRLAVRQLSVWSRRR